MSNSETKNQPVQEIRMSVRRTDLARSSSRATPEVEKPSASSSRPPWRRASSLLCASYRPMEKTDARQASMADSGARGVAVYA